MLSAVSDVDIQGNSHDESMFREWRAFRISLSRAFSPRHTCQELAPAHAIIVAHMSLWISECYKRQSLATLIRVNNLNDHRVDNAAEVTWPVSRRRMMRKPNVMDLTPRLPSLTRFLHDRGTYIVWDTIPVMRPASRSNVLMTVR